MKSVVYTQHGGLEVVVEQMMPIPTVGPNDVLVRVRAVALNHIDVWIRKGLPRLRLNFPHIPGADIAGVVEQVGSVVRSVQPGEEVVIAPGVSCGVCEKCLAGQDNLCQEFTILGEHRHGGYAEYVVVPEANIFTKPSRLTFEEAAAIPLVFLTAWNMLVTNGRIGFGDDVLIWGAGSGVGSAAIQIARLFGAWIIATVGGDWKLEKARELGADEVINHRDADVLEEVRRLTGKRGVDIVFDHVGAATWQTSIKALALGGRLVTCGATSGPEAITDIRYIYARRLSIHGTWVGTKAEFQQVMDLVEAGRLQPVVHQVLPLSEAAKAQQMMERGEHFGKLVLTVPSES